MPELPEVTTMVNGLRKTILKKIVVDVWTDAQKLVKKPKHFSQFKKTIIGQRIEDVKRKGKVIVFTFDKGKTLFWHPKMTGHFLVGKWRQAAGGGWKPLKKGPFEDPMNRFIHIIFFLDNGKMLAFSDLRKFARIELWEDKDIGKAQIVKDLGEDALKLTFEQFKEIIKKAKKKKIKQFLMDQKLIAGIGNIYSDEILFQAGVHPFRTADSLKQDELKKIHKAVGSILKEAIKLAGSSVSSFRRISGAKGKFQEITKVYRREGEGCSKCGTIIERKKLAGRSAHFCPQCQK